MEQPVFKACRNVVMYDMDVCSFLLPHVIHHVLAKGSDTQRNSILSEIQQVLQDTQGTVSLHSPIKAKGAATATKETTARDSMTTPLSASFVEASQLATQKVFSLIEWLSKWMEVVKRKELKDFKHKCAILFRKSYLFTKMITRMV